MRKRCTLCVRAHRDEPAFLIFLILIIFFSVAAAATATHLSICSRLGCAQILCYFIVGVKWMEIKLSEQIHRVRVSVSAVNAKHKLWVRRKCDAMRTSIDETTT